MEVEGVLYLIVSTSSCFNSEQKDTHIADTPRDCALFTCGCCLVGLAVDAQVHNVVTANGAVVDNDIPCPESDSVPL